MPIDDKKWIQSRIIKRLSRLNSVIDAGILEILDVKAEYLNRSPDLTGSNLTQNNVEKMDAYLVDLINIRTNHAEIVKIIKSKAEQHLSHGEEIS